MRVLVMGNSGSGKSVYARALAADGTVVHLDLDTIAWEPGQIAVGRAGDAVRADLLAFIAANPNWVIEGCYGDVIEMALPFCGELVFMNPGQEVCLEHNRQRPWEAHKYASMEAQQSMLPFLLEWVVLYYCRADACSYAWHRRVFDAFTGAKQEIVS